MSSWPGAIPGMQRVVMVKPVTIDADILEMPKMNKNGRKLAGHPTGGVPLIEMWGPEQNLEQPELTQTAVGHTNMLCGDDHRCVLFKPTLSAVAQFRSTFEGAIPHRLRSSLQAFRC